LKRAGYKIMVEPKSVVYHVGGGTLAYNTPFKTYLNFRNSLYTLVKNESIGKLLWLLPVRLILDGLAALLFLTEGKFQHIRSIIKAHWTFFPNLGKALRKRRAAQQLINKASIGKENTNGRFKGSIVWRYYALGRKTFSKL
ncbi:MAG: bifunctional riboflavin kinase/FAD synthetase, partial [Saprospiraceae bacterium]|nr:bifunctional riboflavin kinase/FAD synthetase [Saprospiraceae bacterium]